MNRQLILSLAIIAGGVGLAIAIIATGPELEISPSAPNAPLVRTWQAKPQSVQMSVWAHGTVSPRTESNLVPEVSGRVTAVNDALVSGGFFRKDDVLLEIDPLDYEVALEQARASLAAAESELGNARRAYERQLNLAEKKSTSESQRDEAFNRLKLGEASLREAMARLSRAERDLARTRVTAPYDGRVRTESVDIGQFVTRGTAIASLYATDFAEVRLPIHDAELAFLELPLNGSEGSEGRLPKAILRTTFAGQEHQWESTIVRTEGELDQQTRMINVIAQVERPYEVKNGKPPLAVGLFVEAEILGREMEDIYIVQRSALQSGGQIYLVGEDNRLKFRDVDILRIVGEQVYIGGGLTAGETVSLSTLGNAVEGMEVSPTVAQEPDSL